jgi:molybdate transport system regulatory protein
MQAGPLKLKLQLLCGDTFAMGPGKASLLEAIGEHGSISAAARAIGMSYRRAWSLVDEMNRCFSAPLVETLRGGGRERGARITEAGQRALTAYRELEAAAARVTDSAAFASLRALLRDEPLTPG